MVRSLSSSNTPLRNSQYSNNNATTSSNDFSQLHDLHTQPLIESSQTSNGATQQLITQDNNNAQQDIEIPKPWGILRALDVPSSLSEPPSFEFIQENVEYLVGRANTCHFIVPAPTVSKIHCAIYKARDTYWIIDRHSSNGTYLNDEVKRIPQNEAVRLKCGDIISLAPGTKPGMKKQNVERHRMVFRLFRSDMPSPALLPGSTGIVANHLPSSVSLLDPPCSLVERDYIIQKSLGQGTFATVYKAISRATNEVVAIKVIGRRQFSLHGEHRWKEQLNEISTLRSLHHPGVVRFITSYETMDALYIVTELIPGGELFDQFERYGPYSELDTAMLTKNILEAVAYLHSKGIVHRDLKPENIILTRPEKHCTGCKLIDFGVAKEEAGGRQTFCGSKSYLAPEVLRRSITIHGRGQYTKSVDIWSIGVIVYILLTGCPPFDESNDTFMHNHLSEILKFRGEEWKGISNGAKDFISRCLDVSEKTRITAIQALHHPWIHQTTVLDQSSSSSSSLIQPHASLTPRSSGPGNPILISPSPNVVVGAGLSSSSSSSTTTSSSSMKRKRANSTGNESDFQTVVISS